MCAIAGYIGAGLTDQTTDEMLKTMARRGPDGHGQYQSGPCRLLHTRLAVIDPEGGAQPMQYSQNGENYVLVYNGELYNTGEIRQKLFLLGHTFVSHSDTEVVLHAYAQWGSSCVEMFNGIFAFAVWEEKSKRLFLARDRIGVKPLYYARNQGRFLFASEIKTILCDPDFPAQLDKTGAYQLLLLGPGQIPGSGVFRGIQELEPGCCGIYENQKWTVRRYWCLQDRIHTDSFEKTAETVRELVYDAIQAQMVSDVPIGTFLSGGLDSSIITAICSDASAEKGETLHSFSVDYLNNEKYYTPGKFEPNSDRDFIDIMLGRVKTVHQKTVLSAYDLVGSLEAATDARDLPGMADVDFSLLAFCARVRSKVKVALSGECADEIFGGYPWYRDPEVRVKAGFPWAQTTAQRMDLMAESLKTGSSPSDFVMDLYSDTCRSSDILPENSNEERRMKEMVNLNFRWFMQTLLTRKDRMSMYHGLEVRVPFCDYRIAEYLYAVPWKYKDYQGREKGLLRYAMRGLLPDKILERKKSPYPKTFDPEYEHLVTQRMKLLVEENTSPLFYMIRREKLHEFMYEDISFPWYGQLMRRPQTIAYFLQMDYWLRTNKVQFCW